MNNRIVFLISLTLLLCYCNSVANKVNRENIQNKCERKKRLYNKLMTKGNVLFNVLSNNYRYDQRIKEILEDDYGVFVFYGGDISECDDLNNQIESEFNLKFGKTIIDKVRKSADSINNISNPLFYSRDGTPLEYKIPPIFKGTKAKFDSLANLENIMCPYEFSRDTFIVSFKLWLDTNGNIVRKKALLNYGFYWDSIIADLIDENFQFSPASKINKNDQLYKVPSVIYLEFWRRWYNRW